MPCRCASAYTIFCATPVALYNLRLPLVKMLRDAIMAESIPWDGLAIKKLLVGGLGLLTHYVLNHREWDHYGHILGATFIMAFTLMTIAEYVLDPRVNSVWQALQISCSSAAWYLGTLMASVLIYRAFFHRTR